MPAVQMRTLGSMLFRFGLLAGLISISSVIGLPQSPSGRSSIAGVVRDQAGPALVGARVELSTANVGQQSTTTDQSGSFQFKRLPFGKYQVQVSYQGFDSATIDVVVGSQPLSPVQVV